MLFQFILVSISMVCDRKKTISTLGELTKMFKILKFQDMKKIALITESHLFISHILYFHLHFQTNNDMLHRNK